MFVHFFFSYRASHKVLAMDLFGSKDTSLFDVWSIEHVLSGVSLGHTVLKFRQGRDSLVWMLLAAYLWETVEHYLETGLMGQAVAHWFWGVEHWGNRVVSDPAMMLIGLWIATRYGWSVWYARILSVTWLFVHIVLFPNSMYLHQVSFRSLFG